MKERILVIENLKGKINEIKIQKQDLENEAKTLGIYNITNYFGSDIFRRHFELRGQNSDVIVKKLF